MKKRNILTLTSALLLGGFLASTSLVSCGPRNTVHTITSVAEHATVGGLPSQASSGETITFTISFDAGYVIGEGGIQITRDDGSIVILINNGDGTYTFTMPDANITITVDTAEVVTPYDFMQNMVGDEEYRVTITGTEKGLFDNSSISVNRVVDVGPNSLVINNIGFGQVNGYINKDGKAAYFNGGYNTQTQEIEIVPGYLMENGVDEDGYSDFHDALLLPGDEGDLYNSGLLPTQTSATYSFILSNQNYSDDFYDTMVWAFLCGLTGSLPNYISEASYRAVSETKLIVNLTYSFTYGTNNLNCEYTIEVDLEPEETLNSQIEEILSKDTFERKTIAEGSKGFLTDVVETANRPYALANQTLIQSDEQGNQVGSVTGNIYFNPTEGNEYVMFDAENEETATGELPLLYGLYFDNGKLVLLNQSASGTTTAYYVFGEYKLEDGSTMSGEEIYKTLYGFKSDWELLSYMATVFSLSVSLDEFGVKTYANYFEYVDDYLSGTPNDNDHNYWMQDFYGTIGYTRSYDPLEFSIMYKAKYQYLGYGFRVTLDAEKQPETIEVQVVVLDLQEGVSGSIDYSEIYTYSNFGETSTDFDSYLAGNPVAPEYPEQA